VDACIASVKSLTIKNKTRKALFSSISTPPDVIITRWASWLNGALYYCKNLPAIRLIISQIDGDGIIVEKAKQAVENPKPFQELIAVKECYSGLIEILKGFESSKFTIGNCLTAITKLDF
ncbi:hypothetical protein DMUE_2703, partial [Dictyocoela muelleri]